MVLVGRTLQSIYKARMLHKNCYLLPGVNVAHRVSIAAVKHPLFWNVAIHLAALLCSKSIVVPALYSDDE